MDLPLRRDGIRNDPVAVPSFTLEKLVVALAMQTNLTEAGSARQRTKLRAPLLLPKPMQ